MKTILFMKTTETPDAKGEVQLDKHDEPHYFQIRKREVSYDNSTNDRLYVVESDIYTASEIKAKYGAWTTFIDATAALSLGQTLQPDRQISDPNNPGGPTIPFHFGPEELGITAVELKQQCYNDIQLLEEGKAHTLLAMQAAGDSLTQEEIDFVDAFKTVRTAFLVQYVTDKTNLGF